MFDLRTTAIAGVIVAVLAGFAGWTANGWRLNAKIDQINREHADQLAKSNADALARYAALEKQKQEAIDEANKQAQRNARAATDARNELERLRQQVASSAFGLSTSTCASTRRYAATLSTVFQECVGRLEEMAKDADGHALDSRTLINAFPK